MNDDDRIAYLAGEPTGSIDDMDHRADRADLDELRLLLADPDLWDEPPPALEDAVVNAVTAAAGRSAARSAAPPPSMMVDDRSADQHIDASRAPVVALDRRQRWSRSVAMLGAAAAVIAVVATVVLTTGGSDDTESFAMTLEPTEVLPDASGSARLTRTDSGWQVELDAAGLPRLDEGQFYQAWLRDEAGTLVPIGTFNEGADVVLWAGVSPVLYPTLTITREADDNDQTSSGDRVLVGTITPD